jgi:hypothetical protein
MTITNRTRFKLWQWDKRSRTWLHTAGPDNRTDIEFMLGQRVNGARRHGMWGSAYRALPTREGAPRLSPEEMTAHDIDGMSLEIITEVEGAEDDSRPVAGDTAPQSQDVPAASEVNAVDMVHALLTGAARLRDEVPGTVFGSEAGSDFAVELGEAMRHLRNVGRILREQA